MLVSQYGGLAQLARAPALQAGGHRFDSDILHQNGRRPFEDNSPVEGCAAARCGEGKQRRVAGGPVRKEGVGVAEVLLKLLMLITRRSVGLVVHNHDISESLETRNSSLTYWEKKL
jgi:hypothetical protein